MYLSWSRKGKKVSFVIHNKPLSTEFILMKWLLENPWGCRADCQGGSTRWLKVRNFHHHPMMSWEERGAGRLDLSLMTNDLITICLCNEATIENCDRKDSENFWVAEHIKVWGAGCTKNRHWVCVPLSLYLALCISFIWLFLSHNLVTTL